MRCYENLIRGIPVVLAMTALMGVCMTAAAQAEGEPVEDEPVEDEP